MTSAEQHQEIISIIGSQYFTPIAELIDKWVSRRPVRRDAVGAPFFEGGYAVATIIMLVAALESFVARDRFFSEKQPLNRFVAVPEYMKEIYRYRGYKRLSDLFVVRDAIMHSHVWVQKFAILGVGKRKLISASRKSWRGNRRLEQRLNAKTHRTKLLRLMPYPPAWIGLTWSRPLMSYFQRFVSWRRRALILSHYSHFKYNIKGNVSLLISCQFVWLTCLTARCQEM